VIAGLARITCGNLATSVCRPARRRSPVLLLPFLRLGLKERHHRVANDAALAHRQVPP